jgi:hypothetical protein
MKLLTTSAKRNNPGSIRFPKAAVLTRAAAFLMPPTTWKECLLAAAVKTDVKLKQHLR